MFDQKSLSDAARLGYLLREFQDSPVGVFLYKKAMENIKAGLYELKDVDPHDSKKIQEVQNKIKVADNFQQWIEEGIFEAEQAERYLQEDYEMAMDGSSEPSIQ